MIKLTLYIPPDQPTAKGDDRIFFWRLHEKGLLDKTRFFDEQMEVEFYELWHHEGRRARMGAMMMAPNYSWWHGFYECKKRFNTFMTEGNRMIQKGIV